MFATGVSGQEIRLYALDSLDKVGELEIQDGAWRVDGLFGTWYMNALSLSMIRVLSKYSRYNMPSDSTLAPQSGLLSSSATMD